MVGLQSFIVLCEKPGFMAMACRSALSVLLLFNHLAPAAAAELCDTALSRIGRRALDDAIAKHRDNACAGLKLGPAGLDKTKALSVTSCQLCEHGPAIRGAVTVHIECTTSDQALVKLSVRDDLKAVASANLDTCEIGDVSVAAGTEAGRALLALLDVKKALRQGAKKEIKAFCKSSAP